LNKVIEIKSNTSKGFTRKYLVKRKHEHNDEEFIKSFIPDFAINYTTKFLTE